MSDALSGESGSVPTWTLGWRLQRALAHAGIKGQDMATELGVTRGTVSRWCNDAGRPPRAAYVKQWALRCGVPYEWLTGRMAGPDGGSDLREPPSTCKGTDATVYNLQPRLARCA